MFFSSLSFYFSLFLYAKNGSIRKIRSISKFKTLQPGKETIVFKTLNNISRSKINQTMKLGQLIEYNMRDIFLEKSYKKYGAETISKLFSKKVKLSISLNQQYEVLNTVSFHCMPSSGLVQHLPTPDHLLLPHLKLFRKTNRGLELVSLPHFLHDF